MAFRKKHTDADDKPSTLERLQSLRSEITDESATTKLIDLLIAEHGGEPANTDSEPPAEE